MPKRKRRTVEQWLVELRGDSSPELLRDALGASSGIVVAVAAKRVGEDRIDALAGELAPAFARLRGDDAVKRDPGCRGKLAIAKALHALDRWEPDVFVAGLSVVQLEGWGDSRDDTAAALRGLCGLAHAHMLRPDALDVLADLLADGERAARAAAAQGLGDAGHRDGSSLLRFKLRLGDAESEVVQACVDALLSLAPGDGTRAFLVALLGDHDLRAECVALALGGARDDAALPALIDWAAGAPPEIRHRVGYVAIALVRSDAAIAHLCDAIANRGAPDALAAARARATFRDVPEIASQLRAAAARRSDDARREIEQLVC